MPSMASASTTVARSGRTVAQRGKENSAPSSSKTAPYE